MIALETLRKSDVFGGLTDDELVAIARMAHEETYTAGTQILAESGPAKYLYLVVEGRVVILADIARGRQAVIDTVTKGSSFGWSAMVPPYTLSGTVTAVDSVRLIAIPGEELRGLCKTNCSLCYTIMERLATLISRRLSDTRLQLLSMMYR
jgi:CRP/FNR family cyclic AMP-dependent transcriptional regulator